MAGNQQGKIRKDGGRKGRPGEVQASILGVLNDFGRPATVDEIASALHRPKPITNATLSLMIKHDLIERVGRGVYALPVEPVVVETRSNGRGPTVRGFKQNRNTDDRIRRALNALFPTGIDTVQLLAVSALVADMKEILDHAA